MQGPNTLINENRIRRVFVNIQYQNNANHQGVIRALFLQYCFGFMSMIFKKCTNALSIAYADDISCLFKHTDILKCLSEKNPKSIFNWNCLNKL